jgi:hypothetical protein
METNERTFKTETERFHQQRIAALTKSVEHLKTVVEFYSQQVESPELPTNSNAERAFYLVRLRESTESLERRSEELFWWTAGAAAFRDNFQF